MATETKAQRKARLDALQAKMDAFEARQGKVSGASPAKAFVPAEAKDPAVERKFGFKSFSEYCGAVKQAGTPNGERDPRLFQKAVSGMSEGVGADGGFLIPPEFSSNIFQRVYENDLLSRTDKYTCSGNTMVFPAVDETSRADGSRFGGVKGVWLDEAGQLTKSQPKFRRISLNLKKLACLAYTTEEMLSDASVTLDSYLQKVFAAEIEFKTGDAIVNGTGVGMPLGILNSPALITVAADTGQASKTITLPNIVSMWSRVWAPSKKNLVWLVHQDTTPQLYQLSLGIGAAGVAAFMPPGGLSSAPYATLMGRPVLEVEFCQTLGTVGDIIAVDLSQYITLNKGGAESDVSAHLRFDFDELAFRVIYRMDGTPWWNKDLTPKNGTNTWSPFVTLAAR